MAPKSRKNRSSRKNRKNRSNMRKNRSSRKNRMNRRGGSLSGAPVNDTSMAMPQRDSLAQGGQYLSIHKGQYGGSPGLYPSSVLASTLPSSMVASARTGPLDASMAAIQGMQDGGKRKRKSRKNKKSRMRKNSRKHSRKHRGGAFEGSPVSANSMLLPSGLEKQAALNYEWSMAKDPSSFLPKQ